MTVSELNVMCDELQTLVGASVQDIFTLEEDLVLALWTERGLRYIWLDLRIAKPCVLVMEALPTFQKRQKPLLLFLRKYVRGARLSAVQHLRAFGRVLRLEFSSKEGLVGVDIHSIPHRANVIVKTPSHQMSWAKVQDLVPQAPAGVMAGEDRAPEIFLKEWMIERGFAQSERGESPRPLLSHGELKTLCQKLQQEQQHLLKTQSKLQVELEKSKRLLWRETGDWIKTHQNLNVPEEMVDFVDRMATFSQNIQRCFEEAKKQKQKDEGLVVRMESLVTREGELRECFEKLSSYLDSSEGAAGASEEIARAKVLLKLQKAPRSSAEDQKKGGVRSPGRRFHFEEKFELIVGKNARENLEILRVAQPWDFWLHIRDVPGCHGILKRHRNEIIPEKVLIGAMRKVVELSKSASRVIRAGDFFEVIVCERRFVRPIKGDKVGHVTYQNERIVRLQMLE